LHPKQIDEITRFVIWKFLNFQESEEREYRFMKSLLFGNKLLASLFVVSLTSTACTSSLNLTVSPPDAQITIESLDGGKKSTMEPGSLVLNADKLAGLGISPPLLIRAKAPEKETMTILVTELPRSEKNIVMSLPNKDSAEKADPSDPMAAFPKDPRKWNENIRLVLDAERYLNQKDFDRAIEISKQIRESAPWLSISYVLEGSAYFLQRDLQRARNAFERATTLDPEDLAAANFLKQIDAEIRSPR
jgi:tetratricopeptide (TPR) repeat protein